MVSQRKSLWSITLSVFFVFMIVACSASQLPLAEDELENAIVPLGGRTLYVSVTGSDSNDGLSPAKAFRSLQNATDQTQPGDTVLVMNGTYTQAEPTWNVMNITRSGRADAWIAYRAYPGHTPKIKVRNWTGINVDGAAYILIEGFTVEGNRDEVSLSYALSQKSNLSNPSTSGNCMGVVPKYQSNPEQRAHHVIIRKNTVSKCPGGGIYTTGADYIIVEDNIIWGNAYYSPYANSGLSFYQNRDIDNNTGTKMIIRRNIIYGNKNLVPFYFSDEANPDKRVITDGNGIIIDDARNTQSFAGSSGTPYKGRTYIANNIVYENGARGIHVFLSDNVTVVNNTTYQNSSNPATPDGEITTICASNVRVYNNILYARADRPANTRIGTRQAIEQGFCANTPNPDDKASQVFDYNLVFSGTGFDTDKPKNILGKNPNFINAVRKDFRLQTTSPAIDAGTSNPAAPGDFNRVVRPLGNGVDIGAFEAR
jgi:parallel beta-helix repeat protein